MAGRPRRVIKKAVIARVGLISADELLATPTERWELWRRMITDAHLATPRGDIARCFNCDSPVYIRTAVQRGQKRPLFAHYAGGDATCEWFTGETVAPDQARASQYGGQQESVAHRMLCELIAELASADPRAIEVKVDSYLPPTANSFGRYPDVLINWDGLRPMAIELQLSRTFQTEIAGRSGHYAREGMPLIWVLHGVDLDGEIPQSFRDVLSRHRMNAFFLDTPAIEASRAAGTLMLSCRMAKSDGGFDPARLVRLDALKFPDVGLPYVEDRLSPLLLGEVDTLRRPWFSALASAKATDPSAYIDTRRPYWTPAFDSLLKALPNLQAWVDADVGNRSQLAALIAVAFSLVTAAGGQFRNYATAQDNITAMLNSRLSSHTIGPYAYLIRSMLLRSPIFGLLEGTVGQHINRAIARLDGNLCLESEPEWEAIERLLPEFFNERLRSELASIGATPAWVRTDFDTGTDGEQLY